MPLIAVIFYLLKAGLESRLVDEYTSNVVS